MNAECNRMVFDDFDSFRQSLRGWDVEVTQLSRGALWLGWEQIVFDDHLTISHLSLNKQIIDRMTLDTARFQFVVCFSPNMFCGIPVAEGSMIIFGPGREYRSQLYAGFNSFEISVSESLLRSLSLPLAFNSDRDLAPENCVLRLPANRLSEFRKLARSLFTNYWNETAETTLPLWAADIRDRTLNLLVSTLNEAAGKADPVLQDFTKGWRLTERALHQIDKHGPYSISIPELASFLGCSDRALQAAFRNSLGASPSQYLLARRLQAARKDLLSASPGLDNVTRVATEHDFFHFGRFSQYYLSMFGEKPSDTLKQAHAQ